MDQFNLTMAQQLAQVASTFHQRRTGRIPKSATVILGEKRLVIALPGGLSPAKPGLTRSPAGVAQVQESHPALFHRSSSSLREEVNSITGVAMCALSGEIETTLPAVPPMFAVGTVIQVFLLASSVPADTWSGSCTSEHS